jgi:N-methylhydantoinase A
MHAVWLAEELEIREVIVPWSPGTFSAWGMLQTDMRHDVVRSFYRPVAEIEPALVADSFGALEEEGTGLLEDEGIGVDDRYFARSADMRYVGQEYTVNLSIPAEISLDEIDRSFHDAHRVRYGHSTPGAPVEFVNLRVAAMGRIASATPAYQPPAGEEDPLIGRRNVVFDGRPQETPVLLRQHLRSGTTHEGPVVIEEESSTTVVPPGRTAALDGLGNLVITRDLR